MTDLAATDLTYSFSSLNRTFLGRGQGWLNRGTITFGDGALTIPAAGVALSKGKMGCPRVLSSLKVIESSAAGYLFEYDQSAETLAILIGNSAAPSGSVASVSGSIASVSGSVASISGTTASHATGGVATVSGVAPTFTGVAPTFTGVAPTFTGSAPSQANSLLEKATAYAPASMTLLVEAIGY